MRSVVAFALCLAMTASCFPNNPRARTVSKLAEGASIIGGIAMLSVVNSGADCMVKNGVQTDSCHTKANVLGDVGFGLILAGLVGFIATISTTPDDKSPAALTPLKTDTPPPAPTPAALPPLPAPAAVPAPEPAPAPTPVPAPDPQAPAPAATN
jgi:hypothetical protein